MDSKDNQPGLRLVGASEQQKAAANPGMKLSAPKGSIWAVLTVGPEGGLMFSIETEGGSEAQLKTLLEGTLLAHTEVMHRYLDNGRLSVNDVIPPQWRAKVTDNDTPADPVKT